MWWAASLNQIPLQAVLFAAVGARGSATCATARWPWLLVTLRDRGGRPAQLRQGAARARRARVRRAGLLLLGRARCRGWSGRCAGTGPRSCARPSLGGALRRLLPRRGAVGLRARRPGGVAADLAADHARDGVPQRPRRRAVALGHLEPAGGRRRPAGGPGQPRLGRDRPGRRCAVALRRRRSLRAWVLLAGYLGAAYVLLLVSRAPISGGYGRPGVPLPHRRGRGRRPVPRARARCRCAAPWSPARLASGRCCSSRRRPGSSAGLTAVVCRLLARQLRADYAHVWHDDHPGASFLARAIDGLDGAGRARPRRPGGPARGRHPALRARSTRPRGCCPWSRGNVHFPTSTSSLVVLDEDGTPFRAEVEGDVDSPTGPVPGCGWQVRGGRTLSIPLDAGRLRLRLVAPGRLPRLRRRRHDGARR